MDTINDINRNAESAADHQVEAALKSLPLADPPAALFQAVMTQIQERDPIVHPVFRLSWVDFALSAFFAGMIGLAMLFTGWLPRQIWYPQLNMSMRLQMRWFQTLHVDWVLWSALGVSTAACLIACIVCVRFWLSRRWDTL